MPNGYNDRILHVDLSESRTWVESPGGKFFRKYLGGTGIGAHYLLKGLKAGVDPLSPDNILVFAPGLLTGTNAPAMPRFSVMAKSPLTGTIGKSEAGGFWGPALKQAGFDAIVFTGAANRPVYLFIEEAHVQLLPADELWGKGTGACQRLIREKHGEDVCVAQTGPGGENQVMFANICNELAHFNGRNGLGAVMGSKRLKAIAVRTRGKQLKQKEPDAIRDITKSIAQHMKDHSLAWGLHVNGTPAGVEGLDAAGFLPTNNWQKGRFDGADKIGAVAMEKILVRRKGCYSCPLRCKRVVQIDGELPVDAKYGGPELETLGSLGSCLGIDDLNIVSKANEMCNDYTLDTISLGMTIAFVMECFERGLLTKQDTGGLDLRFGNNDILLPLIDMVAHRRGFGDVIAQGSYRIAQDIGDAALPMLMTVKGQEPPVHDPRWKAGISMQYALSHNGADHWVAEHDQLYKDEDSLGLDALNTLGLLDAVDVRDASWRKVRMFYYTHMLVNAYDCLGACGLGTAPRSILSPGETVQVLTASTGWNSSVWEIMKAGERAFNMQRVFNVREGFGKKDDRLPARFMEALHTPSGDAVCNEKEISDMVDMFYQMAGWDTDGRPLPAKLHELALGEYAL